MLRCRRPLCSEPQQAHLGALVAVARLVYVKYALAIVVWNCAQMSSDAMRGILRQVYRSGPVRSMNVAPRKWRLESSTSLQ
jgi:hypothetical protein